MINVSDVTFARTAVITISVSETQLNEVISQIPVFATVSEEVEFKALNKGHKIVAIFQGMANGDIAFAERKEIAKAVDASPASVSTILSNADKKGEAWAKAYMAWDSEQGELATAKRRAAELEGLLAKHPELRDILLAKIAAESAASDSDNGEIDSDIDIAS